MRNSVLTLLSLCYLWDIWEESFYHSLNLQRRMCEDHLWRGGPVGSTHGKRNFRLHGFSNRHVKHILQKMALFRIYPKFDWLICCSFTQDLYVLPKRIWLSCLVFIQLGAVSWHAPMPRTVLRCGWYILCQDRFWLPLARVPSSWPSHLYLG